MPGSRFPPNARKERDGIQLHYTLYADISARIVAIYNRLCPEVEVYSIDESFLYYPDWNCPDYAGIAHHLRNTVLREIGIPVSVGIAPTRTLAKVCNKLAKSAGGVFSAEQVDMDRELARIPVGDVWGIGWSKKKTLERLGIRTALDLKRCPLHVAKKHLTITGLRTVQELGGSDKRTDGTGRTGISARQSHL